jgi:membrane associated rhomboid family serine protease
MSSAPRWLDRLERRLGWVAVPNIAVLLVTLQALGFLCALSDPIWIERLALIPQLVLAGEAWRVLTWLAIPLSFSPIWLFFVLWFLYFILNLIENEWGAFKTTLYVLVSIVVTVAYSLAFGYPVLEASNFESSLFLASAALYPEMEVRLFFAIPVKVKWLGWLTGAFIIYRFAMGDWLDRFYLLAIYSGYLLFFGPAQLERARLAIRRRKFRSKFRP